MKSTNLVLAGLVLISSLFLSAANANAGDRKIMIPISEAMEQNDAKSRLDAGVKFYFGSQKTPDIAKKLATDKTSTRTNAFGKSDSKACHWVFLSAMLQLQKRAKELGADAVVNIVSNYENIENSSETEFECHAGALMAGVALKGDFVKLSEKK